MEDQDEQDRDAAVLLVGIVISMAAVGSAFSTAAIKRQILRGIIIPSARQPGADTTAVTAGACTASPRSLLTFQHPHRTD